MSIQEECTPTYASLPSAELEFWLSEHAKDIGANEYDPHNLLLRHPDIVGSWLHAGQPVFLRKEATVGGERPDLLVWFYGAASYDIIECKWYREPLIRNQKITPACDSAIERLMGNRDNLIAGRAKLSLSGQTRSVPAPDCPPRAILIGVLGQSGLDHGEEAERIEYALRCSRWKDPFEQRILLITTWQKLLSIHRPTSTVDRSEHVNARQTLRRRINYLVRSALYSSFESQFGQAFDREKIEERITTDTKAQSALWAARLGSVEVDTAVVQTRAMEVIERLVETDLLRDQQIGPSLVNAFFLLADLLFYEEDGDLGCGQWEHGGTYPAVELIRSHPELHPQFSDRITNVVRSDRSENAIGIATHIARTLPSNIAEMWQADKSLSERWAFDDIDRLKEPGVRGLAIAHLHVGYTAALHGNDEAVRFMNSFAAEPTLLMDAATWNRFHSARDPQALLQSIERKAMNPIPELRPIQKYHRALLEATRQIMGMVWVR